MRMNPPIVCLMGPTASGKSDLALMLARQFNGEIISVDSATIYRHMDIGTAKPSLTIQQEIPHHLIDIINPDQRYSAHQFALDASNYVNEIVRRGKVPILVGGTMLYFKALLFGFNELPSANQEIREQLDKEALELGWPHMHQRLMAVDYETATRLKENDSQRIQRALEVYILTGQPLSSFHQDQQKRYWQGPVLSLALIPQDRARLHHNIELRFKIMIEQGLENELKDLRNRFQLVPELPSMRCVGYRQMWQYLEGEYDFNKMMESGVYATRQLAKRQLTWLRSWSNLESFDPYHSDTKELLFQSVQQYVTRHF